MPDALDQFIGGGKQKPDAKPQEDPLDAFIAAGEKAEVPEPEAPDLGAQPVQAGGLPPSLPDEPVDQIAVFINDEPPPTEREDRLFRTSAMNEAAEELHPGVHDSQRRSGLVDPASTRLGNALQDTYGIEVDERTLEGMSGEQIREMVDAAALYSANTMIKTFAEIESKTTSSMFEGPGDGNQTREGKFLRDRGLIPARKARGSEELGVTPPADNTPIFITDPAQARKVMRELKELKDPPGGVKTFLGAVMRGLHDSTFGLASRKPTPLEGEIDAAQDEAAGPIARPAGQLIGFLAGPRQLGAVAGRAVGQRAPLAARGAVMASAARTGVALSGGAVAAIQAEGGIREKLEAGLLSFGMIKITPALVGRIQAKLVGLPAAAQTQAAQKILERTSVFFSEGLADVAIGAGIRGDAFEHALLDFLLGGAIGTVFTGGRLQRPAVDAWLKRNLPRGQSEHVEALAVANRASSELGRGGIRAAADTIGKNLTEVGRENPYSAGRYESQLGAVYILKWDDVTNAVARLVDGAVRARDRHAGNLSHRLGSFDSEAARVAARDFDKGYHDMREIAGRWQPEFEAVQRMGSPSSSIVKDAGLAIRHVPTRAWLNGEIRVRRGSSVLRYRHALEGKVEAPNDAVRRAVEAGQRFTEATGRAMEAEGIHRFNVETQEWEPFKNLGGKVAPRTRSSTFYDIVRAGDSDWRWNHFLKEHVALSGRPQAEVEKHFAELKKDLTSDQSTGGPSRAIQAEGMRLWKEVPDVLHMPNNTKVYLGAAGWDDYHSLRDRRVSGRLAYVRNFGQDFDAPVPTRPKTGMDPTIKEAPLRGPGSKGLAGRDKSRDGIRSSEFVGGVKKLRSSDFDPEERVSTTGGRGLGEQRPNQRRDNPRDKLLRSGGNTQDGPVAKGNFNGRGSRMREQIRKDVDDHAVRVFDEAARALHGVPVTPPLFHGRFQAFNDTLPGRFFQGALNTLRVTMLSATAPLNFPEMLANMRNLAGTRSFVKVLAESSSRHLKDMTPGVAGDTALEGMRQLRAISEAIPKLAFEPARPIESIRRMFTSVIDIPRRMVEEFQENTTALIARDLVGQMQAGKRFGSNYNMMLRLGFDRETSRALARGTATDRQYENVIRIAPTRMVGANTDPMLKSRFENARPVKALVPFQTYAFTVAKDIGRQFESLGKTWQELRGSHMTRGEKARAAMGAISNTVDLGFGKVLAGTGAYLGYQWIYGGDEGFQAGVEEISDDFGRAAWQGFFTASVAGPLGTVARAMNGDAGPEDMIFQVMVAREAIEAVMSKNQYANMSAADRFDRWMTRAVPGKRIIEGVMFAEAMGNTDQALGGKFMSARLAVYRWSDRRADQGLEHLRPQRTTTTGRNPRRGQSIAEHKVFNTAMKKAVQMIRTGKSEHEILGQIVDGINGGGKIRGKRIMRLKDAQASLRNRRILRSALVSRAGGQKKLTAEGRDFQATHPGAYRLAELHDRMLDRMIEVLGR